MKVNEPHGDAQQPRPAPLPRDASEKPEAWEQIDVGRYRPRRIRGSLLGRELG